MIGKDRIDNLNRARSDLAAALQRIPSHGAVAMHSMQDVREALEACAACFSEIEEAFQEIRPRSS